MGQVISKAEYSFQPGQYARGREMVQRFRRCDVRERRTRELTLLAGVGMEEVNWWEQEFDSVWLFSDGSVREDEERATYAWTVWAWNGEIKRECVGVEERESGGGRGPPPLEWSHADCWLGCGGLYVIVDGEGGSRYEWII